MAKMELPYLHIFSIKYSPQKVNKIIDILKKNNIEINNTKKFHIKGYGVELNDAEYEIAYIIDLRDSNNPENLITELESIKGVETEKTQTVGTFKSGGKIENNDNLIYSLGGL
jgi:hypothetical protein